MTYRELCGRLREAGIENPEWDAACLLEHFCGADRNTIVTEPERDFSLDRAAHDAVERRCRREPLQYLLGTWQFYRQEYEVSPDCLIPRSDTEILVEAAIRRLPKGARFADLCTGSGCIAVSTLAERKDTTCLAVEKFPGTLAIAERNAERNGVAERFCGRLADVLTKDCFRDGEKFDAILCNPPYIRTEELAGLEPELSAEPVEALDGGEDGLLFYREILRLHRERLRDGGEILFEIGYDEAKDVTELGKENGFPASELLRDFGGNDRVVILKRG